MEGVGEWTTRTKLRSAACLSLSASAALCCSICALNFNAISMSPDAPSLETRGIFGELRTGGSGGGGDGSRSSSSNMSTISTSDPPEVPCA